MGAAAMTETEKLEALHDEAVRARDWDQVTLCEMAMASSPVDVDLAVSHAEDSLLNRLKAWALAECRKVMREDKYGR